MFVSKREHYLYFSIAQGEGTAGIYFKFSERLLNCGITKKTETLATDRFLAWDGDKEEEHAYKKFLLEFTKQVVADFQENCFPTLVEMSEPQSTAGSAEAMGRFGIHAQPGGSSSADADAAASPPSGCALQ